MLLITHQSKKLINHVLYENRYVLLLGCILVYVGYIYFHKVRGLLAFWIGALLIALSTIKNINNMIIVYLLDNKVNAINNAPIQKANKPRGYIYFHKVRGLLAFWIGALLIAFTLLSNKYTIIINNMIIVYLLDNKVNAINNAPIQKANKPRTL
jgi:predicted membrane protein